MADWLKIAITALTGLVTTVVAAFFSARWATRRAFQERWWERKERAYSEIIDALHDMIRYCELCVEQELKGEQDDHPRKDEFRKRYSDAYWRIEKATDIGAFVISEQAAAVLEELRKKPRLKRDENLSFEVYQQDSEHYREALAKIRRCAHRDLRV